ncbi:COMPASS (complex proteins associated with Set1p) component [Sporothrix epigloea]|uniref:COMPASS (Complex proteins associated with Set1p) component n=1 Tax=Sporothrix epigloea TaxID=1892477 RepID=A0ABP0DMR1_9PEZI
MPASGAATRASRSPSPLSSSNSQRSSSVAPDHNRSSSSSTAGPSTGGSAKRRGAALRGGRPANIRGQSSSNSSSGTARTRKDATATAPFRPKNGTGNKRLSKSTRSSVSPSRIKSEAGSGSDSNDDSGHGDRDFSVDAAHKEAGLETMDHDLNGTRSSNGSGPGMDGNTSDNGPYCICRGPDDHRWMIQCDDCEDWFHGDCVNIKKDDGENMMLSYICPNCTIPGRYVTRYRRLCSLPGCRKAARLYGEDGMSPAEAPFLSSASSTASHFCSDAHRDQWWDSLLGQLAIDRRSLAATGAGGKAAAAAEAKLAVDLLTPAQLLAVLAHTHEPGVGSMLLHGLIGAGSQTKEAAAADDLDPDRMTVEERETTESSAADRIRLAEQIAMCQKMLQLLDMAKARSQDAIKAGLVERDSCGYDRRLQHVGVQPHFQQFLASPEGVALFREEELQAPRFDNNGLPIDYCKLSRSGNGEPADGDDGDNADDNNKAANAETAGMCGRRKCKAHASWFTTLARDVRMQKQEFTRQAAALRNNETRIRLAAIQRSFIMEHSACEVRYVDDSDNSLTALVSDGDYDDSDDDSDPMDESDSVEDAGGRYADAKQEKAAASDAPSSHESAPGTAYIQNEEDDEDMIDLVGYGGDSENDDRG